MDKTADISAIQPRKEPVQERSRARFQAILDAAQGRIAARGVDAVTMSEIAKTAGISIASLYQYFPDKAAIVATLADRFNRVGQDCATQAFLAVTDGPSLKSALSEMTDGYLTAFMTEPAALAIWQATQSDTRLQALTAADDAAHVCTLSKALDVVAPGMDRAQNECLAALIAGMVATVVRRAVTFPPDEAVCIVDMFKTYILAPTLERVLEER